MFNGSVKFRRRLDPLGYDLEHSGVECYPDACPIRMALQLFELVNQCIHVQRNNGTDVWYILPTFLCLVCCNTALNIEVVFLFNRNILAYMLDLIKSLF